MASESNVRHSPASKSLVAPLPKAFAAFWALSKSFSIVASERLLRHFGRFPSLFLVASESNVRH